MPCQLSRVAGDKCVVQFQGKNILGAVETQLTGEKQNPCLYFPLPSLKSDYANILSLKT